MILERSGWECDGEGLAFVVFVRIIAGSCSGLVFWHFQGTRVASETVGSQAAKDEDDSEEEAAVVVAKAK